MNSFRVLTVVFAVAAFALSMSLWRANSVQQEAVSAIKPLQESIAARDEALIEAKKRINRLELTTTVDQAALEELRTELKSLQDTIADQAEEIRFYKGLMDPASLKKGIGFQGFSVQPAALPRHYDFSLTVHQVAANHTRRKGYAVIEIVGELAGQKTTFFLDQLTEKLSQNKVALNFKYFQTIEAEIILPENFVPVRVEVMVYFPDLRAKKIREEFIWPLLD